MRNISFTRIKYLWIQIAIISKKSILLSGLGMISGMFMLTITSLQQVNYEITGDISWHFSNGDTIMMPLYYAIFCFYLSFRLASTFKNMQTKEKRIAFLTLPATQLEKFIAYTTWSVVVSFVLFFAAAFINDLLRLGILACTGALRFWNSELFFAQLPQYTNMFDINIQHISITSAPAFLTFHLLGFSLYLLGACIWYKHVFWKTIASIGAVAFLWTLFTITCVKLLSHKMWFYIVFRHYDIGDMLPWANYIFIAVTTLLIIAIWYISYRLFCSREVISQKTAWFSWLRK